MLQRRNSKQRTIIRDYLKDRYDHPTAEKLFNEIQEQHPKLSLGTIYRNLMYLTSIGEIQALDVGDGSTHFDPNPNPHAHFFCKCCKQVSDVEIDDYNEICEVCAQKLKGKVTKCSVYLEGICQHCLKHNKNSEHM